jgi:hypothetical protein
MADKRKNGATALFNGTPELVCLFSFLTQTYNAELRAANLNNSHFTTLNGGTTL